jgi:probable rRNA maturation factor
LVRRKGSLVAPFFFIYLLSMKQIPIFFFKEGIKFRLSKQSVLMSWILKLINKEKHQLSNINFIFCSDVYLRKINKSYLEHDYFTDIITFDNSDKSKIIDGDIYISIDRVRANSRTYKNSFEDELHRVMAHGVLHLIGYGDKNEKQKTEMKKQEDRWLEKRNF